MKINFKKITSMLVAVFVGTLLVTLGLYYYGQSIYNSALNSHNSDKVVVKEEEKISDVVLWMMNQPKCRGAKANELSEAKRNVLAHQIERILTNIGGDIREQQAFVWLLCQESQFKSNARSQSSAVGISQMILGTAQAEAERLKLGKITLDDLLDTETSITLGYSHFHYLAGQFDGNLAKIGASYNGGSNGSTMRALKTGGLGAHETDAYVTSMFDMTEELRIAKQKKLVQK